MFNLTNLKLHNSYHYQLLDSNKNIIAEDTVYNNANSGLYVADIGSSNTSGTVLTVVYNPLIQTEGGMSYSEEESTVGASLSFHRITEADDVNFGAVISFGATTEFNASSFTGRIINFALGSPYVEEVQSGEETLIKKTYWSEASAYVTKKESTVLRIDVVLNFVTVRPNLPWYFSRELSSILHVNSDYFPTPAPQGILLSSFDINLLGNSELKKQIPTLSSLPLISEPDRKQGKYTIKNPTTSKAQEGKLLLTSPEKNYGIIRSLVFSNVGAINLGGSSSGNIYIPAAILTAQSMFNLLQKELDEYYFFVVAPVGGQQSELIVNGATSSLGLIWNDPKLLNNMAITAVGMTPDEKKSINDFKNTTTGDYYAHYLFGDYWEPPNGSPICPTYLYLDGIPNNLRIGSNISASVQACVNNEWQTIATGSKYQTVYMEPVDNATEYRLVVSAPATNNTSYFVNEVEYLTVPSKTYDPYVLCIGDALNDFGKAGIGITRENLQNMYDTLLSDQTQVTGYNIGITITSEYFYKSTNTIAYLSYEATVNG